VRPVVVLFDLKDDAIVSRVTSVLRTGLLDITLGDWRGAGLLKPSVVRLGHLVTAERSIFLRRLGILGPADLDAVRSGWNRYMRF
jgi:hypothetical protein